VSRSVIRSVSQAVNQSDGQPARQSNLSKYVEEREGKDNAEMKMEQRSWWQQGFSYVNYCFMLYLIV
jgi:hypothetical protein